MDITDFDDMGKIVFQDSSSESETYRDEESREQRL